MRAAAAQEALLIQLVDGINAALPLRPCDSLVHQREHMVRAGVAGDVPESLVELCIAVRLEDLPRLFERLRQKADHIRRILIPLIPVEIPIPFSFLFFDGMVKRKDQPLLKCQVVQLLAHNSSDTVPNFISAYGKTY